MVEAYDYVIVGAGPSAMGLLYGLLEPYLSGDDLDPASLPFTVAVVERGSGPPHEDSTRHPDRWYEASHKKDSKSVELIPSSMTGRENEIPVGKGLGGTANVNACLCIPPLEDDFSTWDESWSPRIMSSVRTILACLKSNESVKSMSDGKMRTNFAATFKDQSIEERLSLADVNFLVKKDAQSGKYIRTNHYSGLVEPILEKFPQWKRFVTWHKGTQAERLILPETGNRITDVECATASGTLVTLRAIKEVFLCAGAIESPALLLVSGIGGSDGQHAGVGKHLVDEVLIPHICLSSFGDTRDLSPSGLSSMAHFDTTKSRRYQLSLIDSASHASVLPAILTQAFRSSALFRSTSVPRLLLRTVAFALDLMSTALYVGIKYTPLGYFLAHFTTGSLLVLLNPHSQGSVSLEFGENREDAKPRRRKDAILKVDVRYLEDTRDVDTLREAWDEFITMKRDDRPGLLPGPLVPICKLIGIDWFRTFCNAFSQSYFHYCGTCAMKGKDGRDDWVVDSDLRLRGYDGVRVCDASVFPYPVSTPPSLTCAALGHSLGIMLNQQSPK